MLLNNNRIRFDDLNLDVVRTILSFCPLKHVFPLSCVSKIFAEAIDHEIVLGRWKGMNKLRKIKDRINKWNINQIKNFVMHFLLFVVFLLIISRS